MLTWIRNNAEKYNIKYSQNVYRNDKRIRGYFGIKVKEEWRQRGVVVHLK
jgi:hypothetical protein